MRPYSYKLCVSGSCNDCTLASTTTRCTSGIATTLYPTVTAALSGLADCGQALFTLTSVFKQGHMNPSVCVQYLALHDHVSSPNPQKAQYGRFRFIDYLNTSISLTAVARQPLARKICKETYSVDCKSEIVHIRSQSPW